MDIVGKHKLFLGIAATLVLISWIAIGIFGLKPGVDLKGGTEWHLNFIAQDVETTELKQFFESDLRAKAFIKRSSDGSIIVRLPDITEITHQEYKEALAEEFGAIQEQSFSSVGPVVGKELRTKSLWAIIAVLLGISLYTVWAFRHVSRPISSWKYGAATLITLVHDVSIPTGLFAVLGGLLGVEVGITFIVALLVVMGFSVHDTIVVFDRVRENLLASYDKKVSLRDTINKSIRETITRSINTSLTLIFVLTALLIIGPPTLFYFTLTVLVGTVVGTYSSLFVASPILYMWGKK